MQTISKMTILLSALMATSAFARLDIRDFGAIPNDDSLHAERANAQAFMEAITAANYTDIAEDKEVYLPEDMTFHSMPVYAEYVRNLTITIDGTIKASKRHHVWPTVKTYNKTTGDLIETKIRNFFDF